MKYIILDFGKVIAGPTTGNWFITPKFLSVIDMRLVDKEELNTAIGKYIGLIEKKIKSLEEEYEKFFMFYQCILQEINYPFYSEDLVKEIAYNITYEEDKYTFYPRVKEELEYLSKTYKIILLTDNWPCVTHILRNAGIESFFEEIYISSFYGLTKKDKEFFFYPIKKYEIEENTTFFIDDAEANLSVASTCGLIPILMDRENKKRTSKYRKINTLFEI